MSSGQLLTASCTKGWLDWIHGELWLLPHGLLRIRTDLTTTWINQSGPTVSDDEPRAETFGDSQIEDIVATHRTNLWMPAEDIVRADIHVGMMVTRVNLHTRDGRRIKLLWLRSDNAERPLATALSSWGIPTS
jgi:hypothetical protein